MQMCFKTRINGWYEYFHSDRFVLCQYEEKGSAAAAAAAAAPAPAPSTPPAIFRGRKREQDDGRGRRRSTNSGVTAAAAAAAAGDASLVHAPRGRHRQQHPWKMKVAYYYQMICIRERTFLFSSNKSSILLIVSHKSIKFHSICGTKRIFLYNYSY